MRGPRKIKEIKRGLSWRVTPSHVGVVAALVIAGCAFGRACRIAGVSDYQMRHFLAPCYHNANWNKRRTGPNRWVGAELERARTVYADPTPLKYGAEGIDADVATICRLAKLHGWPTRRPRHLYRSARDKTKPRGTGGAHRWFGKELERARLAYGNLSKQLKVAAWEIGTTPSVLGRLAVIHGWPSRMMILQMKKKASRLPDGSAGDDAAPPTPASIVAARPGSLPTYAGARTLSLVKA